MKTAVFLGAGASKPFGYPLTNELLPRIFAAIDRGVLFRHANSPAENQADREWFATALRRFFPGLGDLWGRDALPAQPGVGVTDLLTQIDRAILHSESRAGLAPEELVRLRQLTERAVYEAILHDNDRRKAPQRAVLDRFFAWLRPQESEAALVTTNYDAAVDQRIFRHLGQTDQRRSAERIGSAVDFGFPWRTVSEGTLVPRPAAPKWTLLKLHGSVNWLRCSVCGQIYVNPKGAIGAKAFKYGHDTWSECHCNDWAKLRLHLVTPSFVRQTNDAHLLGIWQAALETLRTAERWVIVGFSLPAEDVAIRALFLRAWDGHVLKRKPRVVAVQYVAPGKEMSPSQQLTRDTYRAFFPENRLTYLTSGLEGFLEKPPK